MLLPALACAHTPQPRAETPQVRVEAVADEEWLGVRWRLAPGWHVYWLNPGDSGMATVVDASSETVTLGEPRFPGPERFESPGGITSYGYGDELVVLVPAEGEGLVELDLAWLVCKDVCHYQEARMVVSTEPTRDLGEHVALLPGVVEAERVPGGWRLPGVDLFPSAELEMALTQRRITADGIFLATDGSGPHWGLVRDADGATWRFHLESSP